MKKNSLLKIVNPITALTFLIQALSGLFMWFSLGDYELLNLIHKWSGLGFLSAVLVHVYLNFSWIKANFFPKQKKPDRR